MRIKRIALMLNGDLLEQVTGLLGAKSYSATGNTALEEALWIHKILIRSAEVFRALI